jgi:peptidoglycan/LPS O-acetylase OafA/YrhL
MYAALWRRFPGPWPVKLLLSLALVVAVLAVLYLVVFPWLEPLLPFDEITLGD